MAWGMFQLPDKPNEISVYGTENYYEKTPGRVRRFTYRVDGFVALRGGAKGGQVTTKPLNFKGKQLLLNYLTQPDGTVTVEALDADDKVIGRSKPFSGDAIDSVVAWEQAPDFGGGHTRLRFTLRNADIYSLRFN